VTDDEVEVTYTASASELLARKSVVTGATPPAPEGSDPPDC
jgi:hypothetical protein